MFEEFAEHDLKVYAAYLSDENDILKSASGGVATAMSRHVINIGGWVAGVKYKDDFSGAEYLLTNDFTDLEKFRGSKLIKVEQNGIFASIKEKLDEQKIVLFFGLPCITYALKKYLKNNYENLILCELVCSGRGYEKIHREFCNWLKKKYKSEISYFTVRAKQNSWLPEYNLVTFTNGQIYKFPFKQNEYGQGFKIFKETGCLKCQFKGNSRSGDIMIGDFWGATEGDEFWNKNGVSVVFIETKKGLDFFNMIPGLVKFETSFEKAVCGNLSVIKQNIPHQERELLMPFFKEQGLFAAMKHSKVMTRIKCKRFLKKIPGFEKVLELHRKMSPNSKSHMFEPKVKRKER